MVMHIFFKGGGGEGEGGKQRCILVYVKMVSRAILLQVAAILLVSDENRDKGTPGDEIGSYCLSSFSTPIHSFKR